MHSVSEAARSEAASLPQWQANKCLKKLMIDAELDNKNDKDILGLNC